jgi:peroxiredoxin
MTTLRHRLLTPWTAIVAALVISGAILVGLVGRNAASTAPARSSALVGQKAPAFTERDLVGGTTISLGALRGHRVLLFFSEGVMCEACLRQITDLEARSELLRRRGVEGLVNITTDESAVLRQAVSAYGIRTPTVADTDRSMSTAYDVLGGGMHADTPNHTFILVDRDGTVVFRRDYPSMFVDARELAAELPGA